MKTGASLATLAASLFTRSSTLIMLIVVVGIVAIVLATYLLIARREVAPRLSWGNFKVDFARLSDSDDAGPPSS